MSDKRDVKVKISGEDGTKQAFDSAEHNARGFAGSVTKIVEGIGLAKLFEKAGEYISEFFKGVADEGMAAERTQKQLANTLANVGVTYKDVAGEVEAAVGRVARASGQADDDVAMAFNSLLLKSGDYSKSLAALPFVADLAAGAQITLAEAADVYGRALAGQTKGLRAYGITTSDAAAGLDQLRAKFAGAADVELHTFGGALTAAHNQLKEVEEALGLAIIETPYFRDGLGGLTTGLASLSETLEKNKAAIGHWAAVVVESIKFVAGSVVSLVMLWTTAFDYLYQGTAEWSAKFTNMVMEGAAKLDDVLGQHDLAREQRAGKVNTRTAEDARKFAGEMFKATWQDEKDNWAKLQAVWTAGAASVGESAGHTAGRAAKAATQAAIDEARKQFEQFTKDTEKAAGGFLKDRTSGNFSPRWIGDTPDFRDPNAGPLAGRMGQGDGGLDLGDLSASIPTGIIAAESGMQKLHDHLVDIQGPIGDFANTFATAFEDIGSGAESLGKGLAKAGKAAVAGLARSEGQFWQAKAAAAIGEGILKHDPTAFAAAAKYEAAAAAFFTIGGAVGGSGSRGGSGGSAASQIRDDIGTARVGSVAAASGMSAAPALRGNTFNIIGPNDPVAQRQLVELLNNAADRGHTIR